MLPNPFATETWAKDTIEERVRRAEQDRLLHAAREAGTSEYRREAVPSLLFGWTRRLLSAAPNR